MDLPLARLLALTVTPRIRSQFSDNTPVTVRERSYGTRVQRRRFDEHLRIKR